MLKKLPCMFGRPYALIEIPDNGKTNPGIHKCRVQNCPCKNKPGGCSGTIRTTK